MQKNVNSKIKCSQTRKSRFFTSLLQGSFPGLLVQCSYRPIRDSIDYVSSFINPYGTFTHSDIGRTTSVRFMSHQVVECKV
jgi:hypothetical protein